MHMRIQKHPLRFAKAKRFARCIGRIISQHNPSDWYNQTVKWSKHFTWSVNYWRRVKWSKRSRLNWLHLLLVEEMWTAYVGQSKIDLPACDWRWIGLFHSWTKCSLQLSLSLPGPPGLRAQLNERKRHGKETRIQHLPEVEDKSKTGVTDGQVKQVNPIW